MTAVGYSWIGFVSFTGRGEEKIQSHAMGVPTPPKLEPFCHIILTSTIEDKSNNGSAFL